MTPHAAARRMILAFAILSAACGSGMASWWGGGSPAAPGAPATIRPIPAREDWMGAYLQGSKIGWSRTRIFIDTSALPPRYRIENESRMEIDLLGTAQTLALEFNGSFDADLRPVDIEVHMATPAQTVKVVGVSQGEDIVFTLETPQTRETRTYRRDQVDFVGEDPTLRNALTPLRPGDKFSGHTVNPIGLDLVPYEMEVLREEQVKVGAGFETVLVMVSTMQEIRTTSWILANGSPLKMEGPMGIVFLREPEVVARSRAVGRPIDIAAALSIPVEGELPAEARRAVFRVRGLPAEWRDLEGGVQRVLSRSDSQVRIEVDLARAEGVSGPADLAATGPVASQDPRILAVAREAVGTAKGREAAKRIGEWVFSNLRKEISFTFPTSLDVLESRAGDCNEHTVLYVAMARAAGIPARIATGIAYQDGRFLYHAWPEVNWGEGWIPVEPTWGIFPAPAGRIRLAIGEAMDQTRIGAVAGRIGVAVEESQ